MTTGTRRPSPPGNGVHSYSGERAAREIPPESPTSPVGAPPWSGGWGVCRTTSTPWSRSPWSPSPRRFVPMYPLLGLPLPPAGALPPPPSPSGHYHPLRFWSPPPWNEHSITKQAIVRGDSARRNPAGKKFRSNTPWSGTTRELFGPPQLAPSFVLVPRCTPCFVLVNLLGDCQG